MELLNESNILTEQAKDKIQIAFNEAVENRANELIKEELELEKIKLIEDFNTACSEYEAKVLKKVDLYLTEQIDLFSESIKDELGAYRQNKKTDIAMKAFKTLCETCGVNIAEMTEMAFRQKLKEIDDLSESYANVEHLYTKEKEKNDALKKELMIAEKKQGLNKYEQSKFDKLINETEFEINEKTLDLIIEALDKKQEKETKKPVNESKKDNYWANF